MVPAIEQRNNCFKAGRVSDAWPTDHKPVRTRWVTFHEQKWVRSRERRGLDQWERVHLALGLAAVVSGCYGIGALEAALALTPEIERMPKVKLPSDPVYERFDLALFERALNEAWAEPARRFPHFGRIEAL